MSMEHRETYAASRQYNAPFHKLIRMFTLSVLISFVGTYVGEFLPPALIMPLVLVEFVMLLSAFFIRRRRRPIGYLFVYSFCFISGITIFPTIQYYANVEGSGIVNTAFLLTVIIFAVLSGYAYFSKRDFSFLGGFLTILLLVMIGIGLIQLFTGGFGGPAGMVIAGAGVLLFSGFILFDISRYRQGVSEEYVPLAVLNLYLDFINLFLYLLRFLGLSRD